MTDEVVVLKARQLGATWMIRQMLGQLPQGGGQPIVLGVDCAAGRDVSSLLVRGPTDAATEAQIAALQAATPDLIVMRIP